MFDEDVSVFMPDFSISVTWYGAPWAKDGSTVTLDSSQFSVSDPPTTLTGTVIWDQPDADVLDKREISREYSMMFPAGQFPGIKRGDAVQNDLARYVALNGTNRYRVKTNPLSVEDGAFQRVMLESVK